MNTHSAQDILKIVERVSEYLTESAEFSASTEDTNEDLVALHTALIGFSAPKDQIPNRGLVGLLRDVCTDVDTALHSRLEADKQEVAGYELERKGPSYSNSWDHVRAAEEVAIAALVTEDGELKSDSPIQAANTVANAILSAGHIDYWRVTAGDKLGVDLRKFRDRGQLTSPAGVIVRRTKVEVTRPDPGIPEKAGTPSPGSS